MGIAGRGALSGTQPRTSPPPQHPPPPVRQLSTYRSSSVDGVLSIMSLPLNCSRKATIQLMSSWKSLSRHTVVALYCVLSVCSSLFVNSRRVLEHDAAKNSFPNSCLSCLLVHVVLPRHSFTCVCICWIFSGGMLIIMFLVSNEIPSQIMFLLGGVDLFGASLRPSSLSSVLHAVKASLASFSPCSAPAISSIYASARCPFFNPESL